MPAFLDCHIKQKLKGADGWFELDMCMQLERGSIAAIKGNSGSGKTSFLRMLSGLMKPDDGFIRIGGNSWFDKQSHIYLKPQQRPVGLVFQNYALFPHMTIRENLKFALTNSADTKLLDDYLQRTGLYELQHQKPQYLSGGQQQRVALIRALLRSPDLLLLDEPLVAQDADLRKMLQDDIRRFVRQMQLTTILVSHDDNEIARLADEVFLVEMGKISRHASPGTFFSNGESSKLKGEIIEISAEGWAWVLVGGRTIKVNIPKDKRVGDTILLDTNHPIS